MRIRLITTAAIVVAGLSVPAAVYAAPANRNTPMQVSFSKSKTIKVALKNASDTAMQLKVGDRIVSLDPGKTVALKVEVGTRIEVGATAGKHQAGELLAEATSDLNNTTLTIN
jgi:methyl coenzyme M reductase subunit D